MMKIALTIAALAFGSAIIAQGSDPVITRSHQSTRFESKDALGATVVVVYNRQNQKVYQERTLNDETMYARYENGKVIEYGTIFRPIAATSGQTNSVVK